MVRDHGIWGTPQEFNLFALAELMDGGGLPTAWQKFSRHYTGKQNINLCPVLDPTGDVVEEALCVGHEPFGGRTDVPCEWTMNGQHATTGETRATPYPDAEDTTYRSPFHYKYSAFRWDERLAPQYHAMRKGVPQIIAEKTRGYQEARQKALDCLAALDRIESLLDEPQAAHLRFLLEENLWHLEAMSHCALAWMKAAARLYNQPQAPESPEPVEHHLQAITKLARRGSTERLQANTRGWQGVTLQRGEYLDLNRFLQMFQEYWSETGVTPRSAPTTPTEQKP
jgi:hypothetical protein